MKFSPCLLTIILLICTLDLNAQPYEHSGGVRAGYSSGISYKGFFRHRMAAMELDALYNRHGLNLSILYEHHMEPFKSGQWLIYGGGGIFGGSWETELSMGITAVTGIEYVIRDLPVNFSIDWKPMLNIYRIFEPDWLDFGVSIRYRFSL